MQHHTDIEHVLVMATFSEDGSVPVLGHADDDEVVDLGPYPLKASREPH